MPVLPYQQQVSLSGGGQQTYGQATGVSDAIGRGLSSVAAGIEKVNDAQLHVQDLHDAAAVNDVYANNFSPAVRSALYDPQNGFFTKQGADAVRALPQAEGVVDQIRQQTRATLQNENQQRMFDAMSRRHLEQEMDGAYRHADRENQVWQAQTSDAVVKDKTASAVDHFNDPKFVDGAIAGGLFEIQQYGGSHGQSAEVQAERAKEFVRNTRVAIAQRLLVSDPMAAQAYVQEHSAELAGPQSAVLDHAIKQAVLPIQARNDAEKILNAAPPTPAPAPATADPTATDPASTDPAVAAAASGATASDAQRAAGDVASLQREIGLVQRSSDTAQVKQGRLDILNAELTKAQARAGNTATPGGNATDMRAGVLDMITRGEQLAEQTHPGDPVYRDMVVSQIKSHFNNVVANQVAVQQQAHGLLTQIATGTGKGSPKPTTLDDLFAMDPRARSAFGIIPSESQRGVIAMLDQNQREAMGVPTKSDPAAVQDAFARIHAADDDPNKIRYAEQLVPLFKPGGGAGSGGINREDYDWLKKEVDAQQSVSGRSLTKDLQNVRTSAQSMLVRSTLGSVQPEMATEAAYRFNLDMQSRVDAAIKAGKDPRALLTPGTPEYLLKPERVMSFLQTPQQAVAAQAAAIRAGSREASGKVGTAPARVASDADYAALASGAQFVGPDGKVRVKP